MAGRQRRLEVGAVRVFLNPNRHLFIGPRRGGRVGQNRGPGPGYGLVPARRSLPWLAGPHPGWPLGHVPSRPAGLRALLGLLLLAWAKIAYRVFISLLFFLFQQ